MNLSSWTGFFFTYYIHLNIYIDDTVTVQMYQDEILHPIVRLYIAAVDSEFILIDNNTHPHRADFVDEYLETGNIT